MTAHVTYYLIWDMFFLTNKSFIVPEDTQVSTYPGSCFWNWVTYVLFISLLHCSLFRHIDTIQKLSDILVFNCCGLLDQSSGI